MFHSICAHSEAGIEINEDCFFYNERFVVLIDAATGLNKLHFTPGGTDGQWFSQNTIDILQEQLEDISLPIENILLNTARSLKSKLDQMGYAEYTDSYPSASIMIARRIHNKIELYCLGDCTAKIECSNGIETIHDYAVTKLDHQVIQWLIERAKETNTTVRNVLLEGREHLKHNRTKMNKKDGYWIFEPLGHGIWNGIHKEYLLSEVKSIVLMTDGFACIPDIMHFSDKVLMDKLKKGQAVSMIRALKKIMKEDSDYQQFPRFKDCDDSSVVYVEVSEN